MHNRYLFLFLVGILLSQAGCKDKRQEILYYDDKSVAQVNTYENDKRNGITTVYYRNGKIMATREYKDDVLNGSVIEYSKNGSVSAIIHFKDGTRTDSTMLFFETGELMEKQFLALGGRVIEYQKFRIDGTRDPSMDLINILGKDTVYLGDDARLAIRFGNISNPIFRTGVMIVTDKLRYDAHGEIIGINDTLYMTSTFINLYQYDVKFTSLGKHVVFCQFTQGTGNTFVKTIVGFPFYVLPKE